MIYDFYVPGAFKTDYITDKRPNATGNNLGKRLGKSGSQTSAIGSSSVTIGSGVDLGWQTLAGLRQYMENELAKYPSQHPGVTQADIDIILKASSLFLGLKKQKAVDALNEYYEQHGKYPRLKERQAHLVSQAVLHGYTNAAASAYDKNSTLSFWSLPESAQTVIVDIHYQGYRSVPNGVTSALRNGDWQRAADLLKNDTGKYRSRNKTRSKKIEAEIKSGALPKSGDPCGSGKKLALEQSGLPEKKRRLPSFNYLYIS